MKLSKIKLSALALICAMGVSSCGAEVKKEDGKKDKKEKSSEEEVKVDDTETTAEADVTALETDWNGIKTAITDKSIEGLGSYAGNGEVDSELLIKYTSEHFVQQVLETIEFKYLKKEVLEDGTYYVFTAYMQQGEDPKKTISVFMKAGKLGLTIEYFTAENM